MLLRRTQVDFAFYIALVRAVVLPEGVALSISHVHDLSEGEAGLSLHKTIEAFGTLNATGDVTLFNKFSNKNCCYCWANWRQLRH